VSIIPDPQLWAVDPDHLRALRRRHAEQAFAASQYDRALAEAEELLTATPDDAEAIWVTARAALHVGDACMAEAAIRQLLTLPEARQPASPVQLLSHLSLAVFLQADFATASELARRAIQYDDQSPMAWLHLALGEERLGHSAGAKAALIHAATLSPTGVPRSGDDLPPPTWARILSAAMMHLSEDEQAILTPLEVAWEWFPEAELLRSVSPPISPFIEVLISGEAEAEAEDADDTEDEPDPLLQLLPKARRVALYRGNLLRGTPSTSDLVDRLALSLRSELAAWLGIAFEDLAEPE